MTMHLSVGDYVQSRFQFDYHNGVKVYETFKVERTNAVYSVLRAAPIVDGNNKRQGRVVQTMNDCLRPAGKEGRK